MARYYLIALSFLSLALGWDSLPVKPGRLLAVLIHEMWHGLTAMMGGVQLNVIQIHGDESGETLVTGRLGMTAFLISVSAGYVGTAWTGAALLRSGMKEAWERTTLAVFILVLFYMTYLFTEPGSTAYLVGLLTCLVLVVLLFLGRDAAGKALVVLGSFLIFYSLFDLFDFKKNPAATDAAILSRFLKSRGWAHADGIMTPVSLLWSALILMGVGLSLRSALRHVSVGTPAADPASPETAPPLQSATAPPGDSAPPASSFPPQGPGPVAGASPTGQSTTPATLTSAEAPKPASDVPPGWTDQDIAEMRELAARMKQP